MCGIRVGQLLATAGMILLLCNGLPAGATTYYVKTDGSDSSNGLGWGTAFQHIAKGIEVAAASDTVLVKRGAYFEHITTKCGVALYGGCFGLEGDPSQRPPFPRPDSDANETVIDGQGLDGSVVVLPDSCTDSNTILDGFTIKNGRGKVVGNNIYGGGIYGGLGSSPTIQNNRIVNCEAERFTPGFPASLGGGIYADGSPKIFNNLVENCAVHSTNALGGGICVGGTAPEVRGNTVRNNRAEHGDSGGRGGGIYSGATGAVIQGNMV